MIAPVRAKRLPRLRSGRFPKNERKAMISMKPILTSRKVCWSVIAFLIMMMVIGSIWDYPISCALYNESNWFGIFFAAFGEYPATLGFVAVGGMLLAAHNKEKKLAGVLQCAGGALLVLLGAVMAAMLPTIYLTLPHPVLYAIGILCSAAVLFFVFRFCRGADRKAVMRVALAIFLVIMIEMVFVNIIKLPWGRARMRLVASDPRAYFMPWWQVGDGLKDTLMAAGVAAEEFKSFPSGHVANASVLMLLCLLPQIRPSLASKQPLLFGIGFCWTCLVAFSRLIMGAHYLTDTTVAFAVGFVTMYAVCRIMFKPGSRHQVAEKG